MRDRYRAAILVVPGNRANDWLDEAIATHHTVLVDLGTPLTAKARKSGIRQLAERLRDRDYISDTRIYVRGTDTDIAEALGEGWRCDFPDVRQVVERWEGQQCDAGIVETPAGVAALSSLRRAQEGVARDVGVLLWGPMDWTAATGTWWRHTPTGDDRRPLELFGMAQTSIHAKAAGALFIAGPCCINGEGAAYREALLDFSGYGAVQKISLSPGQSRQIEAAFVEYARNLPVPTERIAWSGGILYGPALGQPPADYCVFRGTGELIEAAYAEYLREVERQGAETAPTSAEALCSTLCGDGAIVLVATWHGEIVGFSAALCGEFALGNRSTWYSYGTWVAPRHRMKGVARRLRGALLAEIRKAGGRSVVAVRYNGQPEPPRGKEIGRVYAIGVGEEV